MGGLTYRFGPIGKDERIRHSHEMRSDPNNTVDGDTARSQLRAYLTGIASESHGHKMLTCYEGNNLVAILTFDDNAFEDYPWVYLHHLAVLPPYQRRGIGTTLLELVKQHANGLPIISRGIDPKSFKPLENAGYRRVAGFERNPVYKWSDRPEHQNDDTPFEPESAAE